MPAILSPNPKRIRQFILNGQIYEGGIDQAYSARNNVGGTGSSNGVSTPTSPFKEEENKQ